ncbi:hypothetical protein BMT54_06550 [Pasteurellaceae bacterium 15-036681]|nr:hypothetical protein BMT54_06550 [Pasteurellaceae bacterium 15-036681]
MKYIAKTIEDVNTGAEVKYHEITAITVDYKNKHSTATVESYISLKTKQAGKQPVGSPVTLSISNAPDIGENVIDWLYAQLIQPVPEDYIEPEDKYYGWVNPYSFTGGTIKEVTIDG